MNKIKIALIFCLPLLLISTNLSANNIDTVQTSVLNNYKLQAEAFPQEKVHLHIDKPTYLSGEIIWFKAHLVNASIHTPLSASKYVYVELIDCERRIVSRIKVRKEESYSGYIKIEENLPEGNYFIRAYTLFMKNLKGEYDNYIPIFISDPSSAKIKIQPTFEYLNNNKVRVSLKITNTTTKSPLIPTLLKISRKNEIINHQKDEKGDYFFDFKFAKKSQAESILVECNTYRKEILITRPANDYELSFYPEGGNIISNTNNIIAFKALDNEGNSLIIKGEIIDEQGNLINNFETHHEGMGSFQLKAKKETKYFAKTSHIGQEKLFELPQAKEAVGLSINTKGDKLVITLSGKEYLNKNEVLYIVAHTRGFLHFVSKYPKESDNIEVNSKDFPSGILHLLLINDKKETLSERLVFCLNEDLAKVKDEKKNNTFSLRDKIPINLTLLNSNGHFAEADNISVSVVDLKDVNPNNTPSIQTRLLLTSDLRGNIVNPNYYFENAEDNDLERRYALDLVMLTHGWRRYNIPQVIQGKIQYPEDPVEVGQVISGRVESLVRGKPVPNGSVIVASTNSLYSNTALTDEKGSFIFEGFEYPDTTRYILRALSHKGSANVRLQIDTDSFLPIHTFPPIRLDNALVKDDESAYINYISKAEQKYTIENGIRTINLKPVEVRGEAFKKKFPTPYSALANKIFSQENIEASMATSLTELLWTIPGAVISDTDIHFMRNSGKPALIYIDGIYYYREGDEESIGWNVVRDHLDNIIPFDMIESVEVFKTAASTSIFGFKGTNGVVMINTKKGNYKGTPKPYFNMKEISPLGYQKPIEFYSPKYETTEEKKNPDPDLRTTIYWNPKLKTYKSGKIEFHFYSADSAGNYMMTVEGVTNEGQIIRYQNEIGIK